MNLEFKKLEAESIDEFKRYTVLRDIYMSEGQFINQFIWSNFYKTKYYSSERFLFFLMEINKRPATMVPLCKKEDIEEAFLTIKNYFKEELHLPLHMYNVDKSTLDMLYTIDGFVENFNVVENRDTFDYMYDAGKLRTLSGRALHKKKNHLNSFLKNYEGRYEYRTLCCSDIDTIKEFHQEWLLKRQIEDERNLIDSEETGVFKVFENCSKLDARMGGIYVDGKLSAYSIGSYAPHLQCAFIHIEKANTTMKGLYNMINQQFLIHEFPDSILVNREDDLGHDGLRQSKMSYNPLRMEEKFHVFEK